MSLSRDAVDFLDALPEVGEPPKKRRTGGGKRAHFEGEPARSLVGVYVSASEKEALVRLAAGAGLTLSDYCRRALRDRIGVRR